MAPGIKKSSRTTQDFVPIKEVRDGVVILKDGSLRGVYIASSINLALKSQDEQGAVLAQFRSFLDSLDFSVQLFVQSRDLDIRPYVALLEQRYIEQTEELMKIQVREYIEFIRTFTEGANIMSKSFFVIVPYAQSAFKAKKFDIIGSVFGGKSDSPSKATESSAFEEQRSQLEQRMSVVEQGLTRTGVRVAQLGTEEVIELYYKMFNMGELERSIQLPQGQTTT
jgi:type IV secretory pathway VirB4 component